MIHIGSFTDCEFASDKDVVNIAKRGVSLDVGARVFDDRDVLIVPTVRDVDEEHRFKAIGLIEGVLWTAVHVYRDERVRFISVRRSNAGEQRA